MTTHYRNTYELEGSTKTACGRHYAEANTKDQNEVTCKVCLRELSKRKDENNVSIDLRKRRNQVCRRSEQLKKQRKKLKDSKK